MNNELPEEIMQKCSRKKVISLCKKLIKKCSYKSGTCTGQLCELAYWLYIYGFSQYIHRLAEETMNYFHFQNVHTVRKLQKHQQKEQQTAGKCLL